MEDLGGHGKRPWVPDPWSWGSSWHGGSHPQTAPSYSCRWRTHIFWEHHGLLVGMHCPRHSGTPGPGQEARAVCGDCTTNLQNPRRGRGTGSCSPPMGHLWRSHSLSSLFLTVSTWAGGRDKQKGLLCFQSLDFEGTSITASPRHEIRLQDNFSWWVCLQPERGQAIWGLSGYSPCLCWPRLMSSCGDLCPSA